MAQSKKKVITLNNDPLWFKDAVIYELHIRAFHDSDQDGFGDFRGLARKMDYLQELGVTALWLLPFYPSPLRDDGYDIADYTDIHPRYGSLRDFRMVLREAEKRGIKVITELVLNHTSDQHPWFQRARAAKPGSRYRDFYMWSKTPEKYRDARIIFKDFETSNWAWDPEAQEYYWHRFYSHQPDLNFENPSVRRALMQVVDFWLEMGVSGLRLDAVPYLFAEEGTSSENLPRTHEFLAELRRHIDRKFEGRMLLAEANQWPEDAAAYFGETDAECHMNFHFPLMPRMFMSLQLEDRFPIIDILEQTPAIREDCQWALFLRNHDELTLEMVTDEERDYMYRVYAQDTQARINLGIRRRLAPLLGNNRRRIELMNGLLFSLPGTPVIYYGDEIGMGDNIYLGDRDGVRTPMQWSADRNAGFSTANPQQLYLPVISDPEYRYEAINVETQEKNPHSLLWWMKRLIAVRKNYKAFSRGTMEFLHPENRKVLAFIRRHEEESILVVANLSRFVQYLELDLSEFEGMTPMEIFGQSPFPRIGELPYFVTLGPHSFYWFSLERTPDEQLRLRQGERDLPEFAVSGASWSAMFDDNKLADAFGRSLHDYFMLARWFRGKARRIKSIHLAERITVPGPAEGAAIVMVRVNYTEGDPDLYALPLMWTDDPARIEDLLDYHQEAVLARLTLTGRDGKPRAGLIFDAFQEEAFAHALLKGIERRRKFKVNGSVLAAQATRQLRTLLEGAKAEELTANVVKTEQSNTSVIFGDRLIFKLFRKLEPGLNPDLELTQFLTQKKFEHIAPMAGSLELDQGKAEPISVGVLQAFVQNEGDAWNWTLDNLARYMDDVLSQRLHEPTPETRLRIELETLETVQSEEDATELIGPYLEMIRLLGRRTAEMHQVLASDVTQPAFKPEAITPHYQRSLYQSMRNLAGKTFDLLGKQQRGLPAGMRPLARQLTDRRKDVMDRFGLLLKHKVSGRRVRVHGDYHLGQVLFTGKDFVILDFEGEPARSLSERRLKRSPLRDVAGMVRSFHYAAYTAVRNQQREGAVPEDRLAVVEAWGRRWYHQVVGAYLLGYLEPARLGNTLTRNPEELQLLFDAFLLEKAIYELGYELNNRQDWVDIPIKGILDLLDDGTA